jgi:hypothetical protein
MPVSFSQKLMVAHIFLENKCVSGNIQCCANQLFEFQTGIALTVLLLLFVSPLSGILLKLKMPFTTDLCCYADSRGTALWLIPGVSTSVFGPVACVVSYPA